MVTANLAAVVHGVWRRRYRAVIQKLLEHPFGMEVRNVTVPDIRKPPAATTTQLMWMRTASPMGDNRNLHKCTVAFASDWGLGVTSLLPHGVRGPCRAACWCTPGRLTHCPLQASLPGLR